MPSEKINMLLLISSFLDNKVCMFTVS